MCMGPGLTSGLRIHPPPRSSNARHLGHARGVLCSIPALRRGGADPWRYMSMVFRIRPTARPSISKGSPGCTVITG